MSVPNAIIALSNPKEGNMSNISTALKIADASKTAVNHPVVLMQAKEMMDTILGEGIIPNENIMRALFRYSALLSATTASKVTEVLLTESELDSMMDDIQELETIGRDVMEE
jgi:hypothetical protein